MPPRIDWKKYNRFFVPGETAPNIAGKIGCSIESVYEHGRKIGFVFQGKNDVREYTRKHVDYLSVMNIAKKRLKMKTPKTEEDASRLQAEMQRILEKRKPNEGLSDSKQIMNAPENEIYNEW